MFDKIVGSIGSFSFRNRKLIAILALILFIAVIILQSFAVIEYSYAEDSAVNELFPQDDTLVLVYDNYDETKINSVIEYLEGDEHVTSIQAYANTLGASMSAADLSAMMGIDTVFVNTLFYIHEYGMATTGMTLTEFTSFISSDDFLNNEMFSSMIDEDTKGQIAQMKSIVDALASEEEMTSAEIAAILGVDEWIVQSVFYIAPLKDVEPKEAIATILATIAGALGFDPDKIEDALEVKPVEKLRFSEFVDIVSEIAGQANEVIKIEQLDQLAMLGEMSALVNDNTPLTAEDLSTLFSSVAGDNEMFNENNITLLYIMSRSNTMDLSAKTVPLYDFFIFLSEEILTNATFSSFFDESVSAQFEEAKVTMEDGRTQLIGPHHSRMVITLDYTPESKEINSFYENLTKMLDEELVMDYYLVGATAMSYEVSQSFRDEYTLISIVTAIAVFAVVLFSFKKFTISVLLICVIECAVFAMMSVMAVTNEPMYFIALILVQCILMGSMIDYGILFTTYYTEVRREYTLETALPEVMKRATHAILTSSLIIVFVTFVCGLLMTGAVGTILQTLCIGSSCAILLILFILPSLLTIFDKLLIKPENSAEHLLAVCEGEPVPAVEATAEAEDIAEASESEKDDNDAEEVCIDPENVDAIEPEAAKEDSEEEHEKDSETDK